MSVIWDLTEIPKKLQELREEPARDLLFVVLFAESVLHLGRS